jgi:hypothetical protein
MEYGEEKGGRGGGKEQRFEFLLLQPKFASFYNVKC